MIWRAIAFDEYHAFPWFPIRGNRRLEEMACAIIHANCNFRLIGRLFRQLVSSILRHPACGALIEFFFTLLNQARGLDDSAFHAPRTNLGIDRYWFGRNGKPNQQCGDSGGNEQNAYNAHDPYDSYSQVWNLID